MKRVSTVFCWSLFLLAAATLVVSAQGTQSAEMHFRVAQVAMQRGDIVVARQELEEAAKLAPGNALIQYNLAVVLQKQGAPQEALDRLKKAMELGLPAAQKSAADELMPVLLYEVQGASKRCNELKHRLDAPLSVSNYYSAYEGCTGAVLDLWPRDERSRQLYTLEVYRLGPPVLEGCAVRLNCTISGCINRGRLSTVTIYFNACAAARDAVDAFAALIELHKRCPNGAC